MTNELLTVSVSFNERWPRRGYMFVPTFLLEKGDQLRFEWTPEEKDRALKIAIEQTDHKADMSQNAILLAEFYVRDTTCFMLPADSLYTVLIENPAFEEGQIGQLRLFRTCVSAQACERSPFPERYYDYQLVHTNEGYVKRCTDWGYRTDLGAIVIEPYSGNGSLSLLFESATMAFDAVETAPAKITKTLFLTVKKGVKIVIQLDRYELENEFVVTQISKVGSVQLHGHLGNSSYLIANEDCMLKIESFVYSKFGIEAPLPADFVALTVYSDQPSGASLLPDSYRLMEVFNEIFNQYELEPL